jgi:prephenate dehydrogenase
MSPYLVRPLDAPPDTDVTVPGSKSLTNRALVAALLADGTSTLTNVLVADDTEGMLAAGGFRDMTRIAAGHPGIWPDICAENRDAITATLDRLVAALTTMRDTVASADRERLLSLLERARQARVNLPARVKRAEDLLEIRVPVPDRPGVLAEITTLASALAVNIHDLEIAHSAEGQAGVLLLFVDADHAERFSGGLVDRGYKPTTRALE